MSKQAHLQLTDKPGLPMTLADKMRVVWVDTLNTYPTGMTSPEMVAELRARFWLEPDYTPDQVYELMRVEVLE